MSDTGFVEKLKSVFKLGAEGAPEFSSGGRAGEALRHAAGMLDPGSASDARFMAQLRECDGSDETEDAKVVAVSQIIGGILRSRF